MRNTVVQRLSRLRATISHVGKALRDWRHGQVGHLSTAITVATIGTMLSIGAWFLVFAWESWAAEAEFHSRANNNAILLQAGITESFNRVVALRAAFESSNGAVSREQFKIFADRLLSGQTAMLNVSWIPRITRDERRNHEAMAAADGIDGYRIRAVRPDGSLGNAPERNEYFPVYYTTEPERARSIYGLDLNDGGPRQQALERSRDGDRLASSEILKLQLGPGDRRGFFVVLPVYAQGLPHETVEDRRRNLLGFVQGVFQIGAMLDNTLHEIKTPVNLFVFAQNAEGSPIYEHPASANSSSIVLRGSQDLTSVPHWSATLRVADMQWNLVAVPSPGTVAQHWTSWILLAAGLLVTAIIVNFIRASDRYALGLVRANQRISELALKDPLTSLANRRAFLDRLSETCAATRRGGRPFGVLCVDVDHFKDVNDTLGHLVGDNLLRRVAERLKNLVRKTDLIARLGGDEFAILQTDLIEPAAAGVLAAKIVETLAVPHRIDGQDVHATGSVGAALSPTEPADPHSIMMQADLALYRAKEDGRNCYRFYDSDLNKKVRERVMISDELHLALDRGELELHYQPQVEISSGRIVGVEALVRWNHPNRGAVLPSVFIPIAERTGIILPLGKWVFEQACRQTRQWLDEGIAPDVVAVNFSAVQCKRPELERNIVESLARSNIGRGQMEIELTESVLLEATQPHRDVIERLRKLGLKIAIDDFGTGYSSLTYLTNYPVDRLKIGQELVFGVTTDSRHASVVRTACRLAHELGIDLIAEGVETNAQAKFLTDASCMYAQGYLFSRPLTAARVTTLLRQRIIPRAEKQVGRELDAA
jgi:diguanylate cyclase (GGDEF)-like protein